MIVLVVITGPILFARGNQKSASNSLKSKPVPLPLLNIAISEAHLLPEQSKFQAMVLI